MQEQKTKTPAKPCKVDFSGRLGPFAAFPDGAVLSLYIEGKPMKAWADTSIPQRLYARWSVNYGITWDAPVLAYEFPPAAGAIKMHDLDHGLFIDAEGTVHVYVFNLLNFDEDTPYKDRVVEMLHLYSSDRGRSWSEPCRIDYGHRYTGSLNAITVLSTGRVVMPFSYMLDGKTFNSTVIISDDQGYTWRQASNFIAVETGSMGLESGAVEPVTVELEDGRIWMVIRTTTGKLYESFSSDGGETWCRAQPTAFRSANAPAGLLRLRDGTIMMCWNHCQGEPIFGGIGYARQSLVAVVRGRDGICRGYREVVRLRPDNDPDHSVCYPWMTELADGNVLVGYLDVDMRRWTDTVKFQAVRVDPNWLEQPYAEEQWRDGTADCSVTPSGVEITPEADDGGSLRLHRSEEDAPVGITWNFPLQTQGEISVRLKLEEGFGGTFIALSDTFLKPGNRQGGLFRIKLDPDGQICTQYRNESEYVHVWRSPKLEISHWYDLVIRWDCMMEMATIRVDGKEAGTILKLEQGDGVSYIRLFAAGVGGGLRVDRIKSKE
ncbi:sialidase family protein [Paenibacillus hodogayensis]|uniref:Sialidase family protein n=1 Tax=Paenibacillus hodogayensis TaxID=279208 RepID=A0ABV5VZA7_9BACL